jgi:hypothetical protein
VDGTVDGDVIRGEAQSGDLGEEADIGVDVVRTRLEQQRIPVRPN